MTRYSPARQPAVLKLADLHLPVVPESPYEFLRIHHVWLHPGKNGLYDETGHPIIESFLRRGDNLGHFPHGCPAPITMCPSPRPDEEGDMLGSIVYLPYANMEHFGHLLTEFAANVGFLLDDSNGIDRIAGADSSLVVPHRAAPSLGRLANLLGLPLSRIFSLESLVSSVRVSQAIIPQPSMFNRYGLVRRHFDHVRRVLASLYRVETQLMMLSGSDRGEKIYLSRVRLPAEARHIHEEETLEQKLQDKGWRILHPEQLPMAEQLSHLSAARTIAGCMGSALHLLMAFGQSFGQRRLIMLGPAPFNANPNVFLQVACQGFPFRYLQCLDPHPLSSKDLQFGFCLDAIISCLDVLAMDLRW